MGNGIGKLTVCFTGREEGRRKHHDIPVILSDPLDEGQGHSFCYVRPDPTRLSSSKVHSEEETMTFKTISGASVSANTWTPLSTTIVDVYSYHSIDRGAAAFESSNSFASIPLQPIPRNLSGPMVSYGIPGSGPLERGFLSGPIERGFMSGPLDRSSGLFSGPIDKSYGGGGAGGDNQFQRSFSHGGALGLGPYRPRSRKGKLMRVLQRAISRTLIPRIGGGQQNSIVAPIKGGVIKDPDWNFGEKQNHNENLTVNSVNFLSSDGSLEDDESLESQNLQWAQGKAGEDRVHVVVSEEHGWVFVGIYDGFNGPDAPDYLLSNLYSFVHKELKGLLWDDGFESATVNGNSNSTTAPVSSSSGCSVFSQSVNRETDDSDRDCARNRTGGDACAHCVVEEKENYPSPSGNDSNMDLDLDSDSNSKRKLGKNTKSKYRGNAAKKWEENQRRWRCEWERERVELDRRLKEQLNKSGSSSTTRAINHGDVLKALSQALRKTEESYLEIADKMVVENPELALMGSCVLVMLMKGEDVYVMNVGDSRAVLAQKAEPDYWLGKIRQDLERINEETMHDLEGSDGDRPGTIPRLTACQLSMDHSTSVDEVHIVHKVLEFSFLVGLFS